MDSFKNYYKILNVSNTASAAQLKSAFRRMAKLYAPDVNSDPASIKFFEDVLEAWNILGNPATRSAYDQSMGFWRPQDSMTAPMGGSSERVQFSQAQGMSAPNFGSEPLRVTQTVIRPPRRETERRRMAEERRQKRQDFLEDYFETGGVVLAVVFSLALLVAAGLFGLSFPLWKEEIVRLSISSVVFTPLFWLVFWALLFFAHPSDASPSSWRRTAAVGSAFCIGTLYSMWIPWFLNNLGELSFVGAFLAWGVPFIFIFAALAILFPRD